METTHAGTQPVPPPYETVAAAETLPSTEQVNGLLQIIESNMHYPAVVQQLVSELPTSADETTGPLWQAFSYISLVRAYLDAGHVFTEGETSSTTAQLIGLAARLEAEGLLAEEAVPGYTPEARNHIIGIHREYGEFVTAATPVIALAASYSRLDFDALRNAAWAVSAVASLQLLASRNPLDGTPPPTLQAGLQQNPNTAFLEAVLRYAHQTMHGLPAEYRTFDPAADHVHEFVRTSQELDVQAIIEKVMVTSETGSLPFGITEKQLKEFIVAAIPPVAVEPVIAIEFRAFRPDELKEEDPDVVRQGQAVAVAGNKRKIIISPNAIQQGLKGNPSERRLQLELKRIVTHEYGHVLHAVLPLPLLKQWLDTIQGSSGSITRYVRRMRYTKPQRVNGEEFSDAIDLFIGRPERLMVVSSAHLQGMDRIYRLCMPGYKQGLRQAIMSRIETKLAFYAAEGISTDALRQIYMKHELEPIPVAHRQKP